MGRGRTAAVVSLAGLVLGFGVVRGWSDEPHDKFSPAVSTLLDEAEAIELISLDPRQRPSGPAESFHGWKVLGRTTLRDAEKRRAIVAAVTRGVAEADKVAGCFEPRHGLRASRGNDSADLVLCFSCRWIEVHVAGKTSSVWTSEAAKSAINQALGAAGVPLAQDVEGP
jgi:hypothetical protein